MARSTSNLTWSQYHFLNCCIRSCGTPLSRPATSSSTTAASESIEAPVKSQLSLMIKCKRAHLDPLVSAQYDSTSQPFMGAKVSRIKGCRQLVFISLSLDHFCSVRSSSTKCNLNSTNTLRMSCLVNGLFSSFMQSIIAFHPFQPPVIARHSAPRLPPVVLSVP